jgi:Flp pilus assembly pilin Flp
MDRVSKLWIRYTQPQSGQTMAEYALVITLVAAAGLVVWGTLGTNISKVISTIAGCI